MEALAAIAAIGLATNVLQFVDLGYKAPSASKEMYGAGNVASHSNQNLASIHVPEEMKRLTRIWSKRVLTSPTSDEEDALLKLANECRQRSVDMACTSQSPREPKSRQQIQGIQSCSQESRG
ncbi:hypothetical protein GGS26DRAFT_509241 [Hypomontagnella submonticulosa]|nr:hypothetical protein GGS26DRAFT_509241 [Hypomontagnella submonticulosa]